MHAARFSAAGMRQAGIIAAAGIDALDTMVERISRRSRERRGWRRGSRGSTAWRSTWPACRRTSSTSDVTAQGLDAEELVTEAGCVGRPSLEHQDRPVRAVTHYGITVEDIDHTLTTSMDVMRSDRQPVLPQS